MALFEPDSTKCPLCGCVVSESDDIIGFTFLGSYDPLIQPLDDSVVHRTCLSRWKDRDAFVQAWNRAAGATQFGRNRQLTVDETGQVRYYPEKTLVEAANAKKPWWRFW